MNVFKYVLLTLSMFAISLSTCKSEELTPRLDLVVAGVSHHTKAGFNNYNPGIGLKASAGNWAFTMGEYRNSYYKTTVFWITEYTPLHYGKFSAGPFAGVASGYTKEQNEIRPFVAGGAINYQATDRVGLSLHMVPPGGAAYNVGFVSLNLTYKLY